MLDKLKTDILTHLETICTQMGARPIGSPANHLAAAYIKHIFQGAGLEIEEQPFDCMDWTDEQTILKQNGEILPARANAFSISCDIYAPATAVCTIKELEEADTTGKICIMYGELTSEGIVPKNWRIINPDRDKKINALIEEKKPEAIITVNPQKYTFTRI